MKKKITVILAVVLMMVLMPVNTFAGSSNPYSDVTKKKVGKSAYTAIKYVKAHSGYKGIIKVKKNKFLPNKKMTRREFIGILANFYGKKNVSVGIDDVLLANKPATAKWATSKMVKVADKLGESITWKGDNKKLSRALASQYLYIFARFDSAFEPR